MAKRGSARGGKQGSGNQGDGKQGAGKPSKTGNPSGKGRDNAPSKGGKK